MRDVGRWLRDGDPLGDERELPADQAQAMRRAIVRAVDARPPALAGWPRPAMVAATLALTIAAGVAVGRRLPVADETARPRPTPERPGGNIDRRQLQFATPGGTRVIWVFDPNFNL